jgi:hypothetical protein
VGLLKDEDYREREIKGGKKYDGQPSVNWLILCRRSEIESPQLDYYKNIG